MIFPAFVCRLAGERSGVWGLFGGAVRRPHRRLEPTQGPAAGSSKQRARTQTEGKWAWPDAAKNIRLSVSDGYQAFQKSMGWGVHSQETAQSHQDGKHFNFSPCLQLRSTSTITHTLDKNNCSIICVELDISGKVLSVSWVWCYSGKSGDWWKENHFHTDSTDMNWKQLLPGRMGMNLNINGML